MIPAAMDTAAIWEGCGTSRVKGFWNTLNLFSLYTFTESWVQFQSLSTAGRSRSLRPGHGGACRGPAAAPAGPGPALRADPPLRQGSSSGMVPVGEAEPCEPIRVKLDAWCSPQCELRWGEGLPGQLFCHSEHFGHAASQNDFTP